MFPVKLHVYDLSGGMAKAMSQQLVGKQIDGIWHTGIVVYDKEYYFGGGISFDPPSRTPFGTPTKVLELGSTEIPEEIFMELLQDISHKYTMQTYNVFEHNCNNFTDEVASLILGTGIPKDIVDLPKEFLATPLGKSIAPMMSGMQDNLMQQSNPLFGTNQPGGAPQVGAQPGPGAATGNNPLPFGGAPQQPMMPPMGGMGAPGMGAPGMGGMGAPGMGGPGAGGLPAGIPPGMIPPGMEGMAQQMMQNPQMMQQLQNMMGGGGMPGMGAPPQPAKPVLGQVCEITSLAQLQGIIKDYSGVVVDFWSPSCPPCMRFKPTYEGSARANKNENIVFCAVETQKNRDSAGFFQVSSIPQFNFFLNGNEQTKFVGANEQKFSAALGQLQGELCGSASEHMGKKYKQFKPMNKLPTSFAATGQQEKMKQFVKNFATTQASEVSSTTNVMQWIDGGFDLNACPQPAINELRELAEVAEDKNKIALVDLFRLLILKDDQASFILTTHWELIEICVIGYNMAQNMQDTDARIMQNYHQMSFKLLANMFTTPGGKAAMQDLERAKSLIEFCNKSFSSCNNKVVMHAALVLFNYLLTSETESKKPLQSILEQSITAIEQVWQNEAQNDRDVLLTTLLCMCRLLYKNHDLTKWTEDNFKSALKQTLASLSQRASALPAEIIQATQDVQSMVNLD